MIYVYCIIKNEFLFLIVIRYRYIKFFTTFI
ncbi:hypothetical protein ACFW04_003808 [Cataglyphis niger]